MVRVQAVAAIVIIVGFFIVVLVPAVSPQAKLDPTMVETVKSVTLTLVGWLVGSYGKSSSTESEK